MLPIDVKSRITSKWPQTLCYVQEFSGGTDHYSAIVITPAFQGIPLLKRHRMVMELFQSEMDSGEVHALTLKLLTPEQWQIERPLLESIGRRFDEE